MKIVYIFRKPALYYDPYQFNLIMILNELLDTNKHTQHINRQEIVGRFFFDVHQW